jgi:hypothetical protein
MFHSIYTINAMLPAVQFINRCLSGAKVVLKAIILEHPAVHYAEEVHAQSWQEVRHQFRSICGKHSGLDTFRPKNAGRVLSWERGTPAERLIYSGQVKIGKVTGELTVLT